MGVSKQDAVAELLDVTSDHRRVDSHKWHALNTHKHIHTRIISPLLAMALTAMHIKSRTPSTFPAFLLCLLREFLISEGSNCQLSDVRKGGGQSVYFWSSGHLLDPPHLYSRQHSDGVKYMMIAWRSESLGCAVRVMPLSPAMGATVGVMVYDPECPTLNNRIEFVRLRD